MSRYLTLINEIKDYITDNGNGEITGNRLQRVLEDMVNELGDHTKFIGVVAPEDKFEGAEGYLFAFAVKAGVYTNFGGYTVRPDEIAILIYDGGWKKYGIDVVTDAQLENTVGEITGRLNALSNAVNESLQKLSNEVGGTITELDNKLSGNIEDLAKTVDNLVVQELGDSKDVAVSQKVVKDELKKVNDVIKAQVVQEFGDSTKTVISQKVLTERFCEVEEEVETLTKTKISKQQSAEQGNVVMFGEGGEVADSNIEVSNVAKQNGYYESMIVGASKNLAGNNIVTAKYTYRPTADTTDVADGVAKISSVKGNTIVWNQLFDYSTIIQGSKATYDNSTGIFTCTPIDQSFILRTKTYAKINHYHLISCEIKSDNDANVSIWNGISVPVVVSATSNWKKVTSIIKCIKSKSSLGVSSADSVNHFEVKNIKAFDLTQMFGEGNEPTIEEFEAMFPNDYYEYNAGELKSIEDFSIKSVGFNAWDEEWEVGMISGQNGSIQEASDQIRSKNYIPILPNMLYNINTQVKRQNFIVVAYDDEYRYIEYLVYGGSEYKFRTPQNAKYVKFCTYNEKYGNTYNNDICINLSHSGIRNGEYEPYQEDILPINTSTIKDENGEVLFPNGLCSAGEAHDELLYDKSLGKWKAVKRIGSVDMGNLVWYYESSHDGFISNMEFPSATGKNAVFNGLSTMYPYKGSYDKVGDKEMGYIYFIRIFIKDSSYTDADLFRQSLKGQILYYELAEPIEVVLDDFTSNYKVSDWGTEEILMDSTPIVPVIYDVEYALNAVDTLRNMPTNYISKESLDAFLSALGSAMGGTWTAIYNETNNRYDFSFSANASATELIEE